MKKVNRTNALVVELMMAVLFFMLASTVLAQVFGHARVVSNRAEVLTRALAAAQNTADRLYASGDPGQTLSEEGFTQSEEGLWEKEEEELRIVASVSPGALRKSEVRVMLEEEELVRLPCSRYLPGDRAKEEVLP